MRYVFVILYCCFAENNFAQHTAMGIVEKSQYINTYTPLKNTAGITLQIPCSYGKADLQWADSLPNLNSLQIEGIDLIYTDHPATANLRELNMCRITTLATRYPALLTDTNINWRVLRQKAGTEKLQAISLYHGFVVYARPAQATATPDTAKLTTMLTAEKKLVRKKRRGFTAPDTIRLREIYEIEPYTYIGKLPRLEALNYLDIKIKEADKNKRDSLFVYELPETDSMEVREVRPAPEDSTVLKVFDRMNWQRTLVVADVTASMYPYMGQLLLWLRLHEDERPIHRFVFFNDGDRKDESEKTAGQTGGIYTTESSVWEVVEKQLYKAMSAGTGGALPENNMEALLYGIAACSDCSSVVMIADNWSPVSDMALLPQVNKPVHIIVCGVVSKVHPHYLNIARQTGGSIHLIDQDLAKLASLQEGEKITIGGYTYQLVNGLFKLLQ